MPPKKPLYTSPLLAILQGGKQTQAPKPVQFGVPQAQIPNFTTTQTRTSTPAMTGQPAPIVPRMPVQQPGLQSMIPVNPLDIIRRGKDQSISQAPARGVVRGAAQDFGSALKTIAGGDLSPLGSPGDAARGIGKFALNLPNYMVAGFVGTGRSIMEETLPRVIPGVTRKSLREDFNRAKGIDEWLLKGEVDSWQEIKQQMQTAIDDSPNAQEWEKKYLPLSVAVAGFAMDASGIGNPASKGVTTKVLSDLARQTDTKTISSSLLKAGTPQEVVDIATPLVARATTPEQVQNALVRASESVLDKIPVRTEVSNDMVLENMARLKADPMRVPPDDFTRFEDLGKQMERRPLTPDEIAEAKAIVERVDGNLPSPEVGAMDIKKPAPVKAPNPKNFKTAEEYVKAQPQTPTVPNRDYPGLRKQGGFADFFAPIKARETAPTVKPKTEQRIKIDADIKDIRKSLQNKDLTANKIGELETRLSLTEDAIPDVSLIRRIAGKQLANGDTLSQVQATAMKIMAQSDFLKGISKTDAEKILQKPKEYSAREVEGARIVRRANLDQLVTEFGYDSLDEAGLAIRQFDEVKSEIAAVKANLKEAKGDRALSNKVTKLVTTATAKRRDEVKFLKDQFGLVDTDVRKATGGRDFRTMSEGRFNDTVNKMEQLGIERADTMQAKAELMDLMERRNFEKVENYRRVSEFPEVHKMNAQQFREYAEALEQFQTDDVFLTQRQLEVVDRSSLAGVRTIREAKERLLEHIQKMPGLEDTKFEDLNIAPGWFDGWAYDTALAEKNPFYQYLVTRTHEHMLVGEAEFLTIQKKALDLASKAKKSRKDGAGNFLKQLFVPKHEEIIQYLEAPIDQKATFAKALTKEELDYANFASDYYSKAYDHLVMQKELQGSKYIDEYFNHTRRAFLEAWSDDGFIKAAKELWQSQKDSLMASNILDQNTGKILPKSKFFANTMYRSGELVPTKNFTRAFLQYTKTFERKKMFDRMIPEMDIYVQSLPPTGLTKNGLKTDHRLKDFVYKYINNKKGRTVPVLEVIHQNNPADIGLRMSNTLVSILDLGGSVIAQTASLVGEAIATYQGIGKLGVLRAAKRRVWDTGIKRMVDPNASKILKDNEEFIGRNLWTELAEVDTPIQDKFMSGLFGGFSQATVEANKVFLLASITKAELKAGKLSPQRLAQLRLDAGRWRDMGKDVKSIVGSTSVGQATTKYKGWAIPIMRTNIKNLQKLTKDLAKGDMKKALTSRELQETWRMIEVSAVAILLGQYVMSQNEEDTFVGKLKARAYMEANTLLSGIDPRLFVAAPRVVSFAQQLADNLIKIVFMETYNTDTRWGEEGDLKGAKGLQRQLTPSAIRSLQSPSTSTGDKDLDAIKKEESQSLKDATDKVESVFKEVENMTPEQRRERLLQEEPDVINKVVDKLLEAQKKAENPEQFKADSQIKKLTNESKAKYVLAKIDKMPLEERRAYIGGLLEREVISANVVNRLAELASERGIIEQ